MSQIATSLGLTLVLVLSTTVAATTPEEAKRREKQERDEFYELLLIFADTIDQIDRNYVEKISRRELLEAAIEGALKKLDPYSNYIAPDEFDEFRLEVDNTFGGIGVQIGSQNDQLRIISPMVGTPAYRAGVLAGDLLLSIDGKSTAEMNVEEAVKLVKGRPGSKVVLVVLHPFTGETEQLTLVRERIKVDTVLGDQRKEDDEWQYMYDVEHRIGYVRITTFGRETASDLRAVLAELDEQGLQALVLDLRFNSGGLLRAAIEVADLFLREGKIVGTDGRNIKPRAWNATEKNTYHDFPMVVLVNQFSASASEIVAAALQDHKRANVVGVRTFGKASIQNVVELEDGRSAIKITTGSYQRPNGNSIHRFPGESEWGVQPSDGLEVKLEARALAKLMAARRKRDIVDRRAEPDAFEDVQLAKAVEHLQRLASEQEKKAAPEVARQALD